MRHPSRQLCRVVVTLSFLLLSGGIHGVNAVARRTKQEDKQSPIQAPVSSPPPTLSPTFYSTVAPTVSSTVGSTLAPTFPSTLSPTFYPTIPETKYTPPEETTLEPTMLATTLETTLPTAIPTIKPPTHVPTGLPSLFPTAVTTKVTLPKLEVAFTAEETVDSAQLYQELNALVLGLLSNVTGLDGLDHVDLQIAVNTTVRALRRQEQRHLQLTMHANVTGSAYFRGTSVPTTEEASAYLRAYLKANENLDEILVENDSGIRNVVVSVEGDVVSDDDTRLDENVLNAIREPTNQSSDDPSSGLVAGLVIGLVALVLSVALVAWQRGKYRRESHERKDREQSWLRRNRSEMASPQQVLDTTLSEERGEDDQSVAEVSVTDSIYTTDTDTLGYGPSSKSPDKYDAKRLDKVIQSAQKSFINRDKDENAYT